MHLLIEHGAGKNAHHSKIGHTHVAMLLFFGRHSLAEKLLYIPRINEELSIGKTEICATLDKIYREESEQRQLQKPYVFFFTLPTVSEEQHNSTSLLIFVL